MKKTIFASILFALAIGSVWGQGIEITFTPEGIRSATENTELLLSDPLINYSSFYVPPAFKDEKATASGAEEEGAAAFGGFGIGLETEVSGPNKSISIPLNYAMKKFNFGVTLPYIYQRKMEYQAESKESSGIGDIAVSAGFGSWLGNSMLFNLNVFAKLPTGDDEKMVDGYLVPLGTGSTDWVFSLSLMKIFSRFSFSGNFSYKMNGASEKIAEITHTNIDSIETINYDITNGDMLNFTGGLDFFLSPNWTIGGWVNFITVAEGSTDEEHSYTWKQGYTETGLSNKQDMTLVDLIPMLSYRLMMTDLTLMAKIPVVTERNEDNNEGDRGLTILFKLGRKI